MAPASVSASAESESFMVGGEEAREVLAARFRRLFFASCSESVSSNFLFSRLGERVWVGVSISTSELLLVSFPLSGTDEVLVAGTGALPLPAICPPGLILTLLLLPENLPLLGRRTDMRPFSRLPDRRRTGVRIASSSSSDVSEESLCPSLSIARSFRGLSSTSSALLCSTADRV